MLLLLGPVLVKVYGVFRELTGRNAERSVVAEERGA